MVHVWRSSKIKCCNLQLMILWHVPRNRCSESGSFYLESVWVMMPESIELDCSMLHVRARKTSMLLLLTCCVKFLVCVPVLTFMLSAQEALLPKSALPCCLSGCWRKIYPSRLVGAFFIVAQNDLGQREILKNL